jgi:hypothetical protein
LHVDNLAIEPNRNIAIHIAAHLGRLYTPLQRYDPRGQPDNGADPKQHTHAKNLPLLMNFISCFNCT